MRQMAVLLLFAQLLRSAAFEWKLKSLHKLSHPIVFANATGVTTQTEGIINEGETRSFFGPTVAVGDNHGSTAPWYNTLLAGREFALNPASAAGRTVVVVAYGEATTTVTRRVNGAVDWQGAFGTPRSEQSFAWASSNLEFAFSTDVLMTVSMNTATGNRPWPPVSPVAQTIYGQCSGRCRIQIWGGDTSVPIERTCTDGSAANVTAGEFTGTTNDYNGVSCKWRAPDGHRIAGAAYEGIGMPPQMTTFVAPEHFQLVTPVPQVLQYLLFISAGPAQCTYNGGSVTLTGSSGVYHVRLTAVSLGTVVECDMPVTAMGDGWTNLIAPGLTTTTTTVSTTTSTATTATATSVSTTVTTATTSTTTTSFSTISTTTTSLTTTVASTTTASTTTATHITTTTTVSTTTTASATTATHTATTTTASTTITTSTRTATHTRTTTSASTTTDTSTTTATHTITTTTASTTTTTSTTTATHTTTTTTTSTTTDTSTTTATHTTATTTASTTSNTSTTTTTTSTASTTTTTGTTATQTTTTTTASTTTNTSTTTTTTTTASTTTTNTTTTNTTTTYTTTTTTTTTTAENLTVAALVDRMETLEATLLTSIVENNLTTVTQRIDGLTLVGAKLNASAASAAGGLTVPMGEAEVTLPASIFPHLGVEGVVLILASADLVAEGVESKVELASVLNVNLFALDGRRLHVTDLAQPVEVVMPVNDSTGPQCAFWDRGSSDWATAGVKLDSVSTGIVKCTSTHLTLFAAIVKGFVSTLVCSQVTLLNAESILELGRGNWQTTSGPLMLWSLLAAFMLLLSWAAWLDWVRWRQGTARDELLLVPWHEDITDDQANEEQRGLSARAVGGVLACCTCCVSCGALRDVADEIFSQWFNYFGEVRDLVEGLTGGLELGVPTVGRIAMLVHRLLVRTLVLSARRQVATSLGVSWDISTLVMEEAELTEVVEAYRKRRMPDTRGSPNSHDVQMNVSTTTAVREEAWGRLHHDLEVKLDVAMQASARWSSLPGTVLSLFLHQNPINTCVVRCVLTSCKQRVLLFMVDVIGSFMLATVFFTTSGTPKKRGRGLECDTDDSTFEFIGRLLAIGTGSLFFAGLPAIILAALCTRGPKKIDFEGSPQWKRQLLIWRLQDRAIWIVGSLYVAFCTFFICLFLANVDPKDHMEWIVSGVISLVESIVVIPLATAVILPVLVTVCLLTMSVHRRVTKEELVRDLHLQCKSDMNMAVVVGTI